MKLGQIKKNVRIYIQSRNCLSFFFLSLSTCGNLLLQLAFSRLAVHLYSPAPTLISSPQDHMIPSPVKSWIMIWSQITLSKIFTISLFVRIYLSFFFHHAVCWNPLCSELYLLLSMVDLDSSLQQIELLVLILVQLAAAASTSMGIIWHCCCCSITTGTSWASCCFWPRACTSWFLFMLFDLFRKFQVYW